MNYPSLLILAGGLLFQETSARLEMCIITNPAEGSLYDPGQDIALAGGCTDADGVPLDDSLLTWKVEYRLDNSSTVKMADTRGSSSGSFTANATEGEGAPWYRITLTAGHAGDTLARGVRDILPRSGKSVQVYLSDLDWKEITNGWGPAEKDQSNGEADVNDGSTISLRYQGYAKGFGVHAPSDIQVPLHGQCFSLQSDVGADDEVHGGGSVTFKVSGDGTLLKETPVLHGEDPIRLLDVDVTGKQDVHLEVTDGNDGNVADHASWAGVRAICKEGFAPVASTRRISRPAFSGNGFTAAITGGGTEIAFRFNLASAAEVSLELKDAQGRVLAESDRRSMSSGDHQWNWSPKGINSPSGILFAVLKAGGSGRMRKIAAIRY